MMRSAVALTLLSFVAPCGVPTSAEAAAPTCHGRTPTIVAPYGDVTGTTGDDVIFATGRGQLIRGGDGNDVICLDGPADRLPSIYGDAGDDLIDTSEVGPGRGIFVDLGPGADTFLGGSANESVNAVPPSPAEYRLEADAISTGDGADAVFAFAGVPVSTGAGRDLVAVYLAPQSSTSPQMKLGRGRDTLSLGADPQTGVIDADLEAGVVTIDDVLLPVRGVDDVAAYAQRVSAKGDEKPNELKVRACHVELEGGGGDDLLAMYQSDGDDGGPYDYCAVPASSMRGEGGDDTMVGRNGPDVLLGGPGDDLARGLEGDDTCRAEREQSCERS